MMMRNIMPVSLLDTMYISQYVDYNNIQASTKLSENSISPSKTDMRFISKVIKDAS